MDGTGPDDADATLTDDELATLIGRPTAGPQAERRLRQRQDSRSLRAAASWDQAAVFHPILCKDLSTNGIGFFCAVKPEGDSVIVRLSADDQPSMFVAAKVIYCNDTSGEPSFPFVVGCLFTGRLGTAED